MVIINNPAGSDPMEVLEDTSAERVGNRIRKIRMARGLSQAELGELVGLNADRIQKYENGARKPKADMLKKIASSLEVSSLSLIDPVTTNELSAMFAMFEMESTFNMKIEKTGDDHVPGMCLTIEFTEPLYRHMKEWYEKYTQIQAELEAASSKSEAEEIMKSYHLWEWSYPNALIEKDARDFQKLRLKKKIEELQAAYDKLDEGSP